MIYLNQAAPALRKRKRKRKNEIINRLGPVYDRVNQSGQGLASSLAKAGIELGTKALGSEFGKKINKQRYWQHTEYFKSGVSKIKNKNVKKALTSAIADMVVDEVQNRAKNRYSTLFDDYKKWKVFQTFKLKILFKKSVMKTF